MLSSRCLVAASVLAALVFGAGFADAAEPSPDAIEKARPHYERGIKFFDSGDYDAARAELERAYAIAPSYRILYNLGQIQLKKDDYVGALKNFELYLEEGSNDIASVRKQQVTSEIERLRTLVASVTVEANVPDAEITVDDVAIGKTPLKSAVLVNPGRRKIGATHPGKVPGAKVVEVVGKDAISVHLDLQDTVRLIAIDKPSRRIPWVGWGATAALAVGAGVTGYIALNTSNALADKRGQLHVSASDLDSYSSRARAFGIICDVATVGAVVAGGISLYYTLRWNKEYNRELDTWQRGAAPPAAALHWTPNGLAGTF